MRKIWIGSLGILLVLLFANSGYPAQGRAWVPASGDIGLRFGIQHEIDFELRDNYDLDNGLTDGCPRGAILGTDCSGSVTPRDGFVQQETRLIVEGHQSDIWRARVVLEADEVWPLDTAGTGDQGAMNLERAWADIRIYDTPVRVRVGHFFDRLDPFGLVYAEDDSGVKVYARHGNISWAIWYSQENEVSDGGRLGQTAIRGRDGDQHYYMARTTLDFGSFQLSPALGYVRNKNTTTDNRFATGAPSQDAYGNACHNFRSAGSVNAFCGPVNTIASGVTVDEGVVYPGLIAKGNFGPVSFVGEVFGAFGEIGDDSAVDAQRNQDVGAFLAAANVGVKLGAWTPHAGFIFMSGDDNPHDADAEAWAPISANSHLLGSRGILMDDRLQVLGISDDNLTAEGDSPLARFYGLQPGIMAVFVGLKGRPTKKIKTDLWLAYLQWDMEKQWEYKRGIVSRTFCAPTRDSSEKGTCSNAVFSNGVADGRGLISTVDDEVGWELNATVTYDYNRHVSLRIAAAVFWPGDGAEVVAQCANAAPRDNNNLLNGIAGQIGCGGTGFTVSGVPGVFPGGSEIESVAGIGRADDEAVNIDAELKVEF
jgi:hypothetical protein